MKRNVRIALGGALMVVFAMVGCHWQKAPKGFPKTVPFKVIVTNESKPVSDATVTMTPESRDNSWTVTGKTDATGTVSPQTIAGTFVKKGVPIGHFHVTITKIPDVSSMTTLVNDGTPGGSAAYAEEVARLRAENPSEVPDFYGNLDSTPLITEVTKRGEFKVELTDHFLEE